MKSILLLLLVLLVATVAVVVSAANNDNNTHRHYFPVASVGMNQATVSALYSRFFRQTLHDQLRSQLRDTAETWSRAFNVAPFRVCGSAGPYEAWGYFGETTPPRFDVSVTSSVLGARILSSPAPAPSSSNGTSTTTTTSAALLQVSGVATVSAWMLLDANFQQAFCMDYDCDCTQGPSNWTLCARSNTTVSFDLRWSLNISFNVPAGSSSSSSSSSSSTTWPVTLDFTADVDIVGYSTATTCAAMQPAKLNDFPWHDPVFENFNSTFFANVSAGMRLLSREARNTTRDFLVAEFGEVQLRSSWGTWVTQYHEQQNGLRYWYRFDSLESTAVDDHSRHNNESILMATVIANVSMAAESCNVFSSSTGGCLQFNPFGKQQYAAMLLPRTWEQSADSFSADAVAARIVASSSLLQILVWNAYMANSFAHNTSMMVIDANVSEEVHLSLPVLDIVPATAADSKKKSNSNDDNQVPAEILLTVRKGDVKATCKNHSLTLLEAEFSNVAMICNISENGTLVQGPVSSKNNKDDDRLFRALVTLQIERFNFTGSTFAVEKPTSGIPTATLVSAVEEALRRTMHADNKMLVHEGLSLPAVTGLLWAPDAGSEPRAPFLKIDALGNSTARILFDVQQPNATVAPLPPSQLSEVNIMTSLFFGESGDCNLHDSKHLIQTVSQWSDSECRLVATVPTEFLGGGDSSSSSSIPLYGRVKDFDSIFIQDEFPNSPPWPMQLHWPCLDAACTQCGNSSTGSSDSDTLFGTCHAVEIANPKSNNLHALLDVMPSDFSLDLNTTGAGLCDSSKNTAAATEKSTTANVFAVGTTSVCDSSSSRSAVVDLVPNSSTSVVCALVPDAQTTVALSPSTRQLFGPCSACPKSLATVDAQCSFQSAAVSNFSSPQCAEPAQMSIGVAVIPLSAIPTCPPPLRPPWESGSGSSSSAKTLAIVLGTVLPVAAIGIVVAVVLFVRYRRSQQEAEYRSVGAGVLEEEGGGATSEAVDVGNASFATQSTVTGLDDAEQQKQSSAAVPQQQAAATTRPPETLHALPLAAKIAVSGAFLCSCVCSGLWFSTAGSPFQISKITAQTLRLPHNVSTVPLQSFMDSWNTAFAACCVFLAVCLLVVQLCIFSQRFVSLLRISLATGVSFLRFTVFGAGVLISVSALLIPPFYLSGLEAATIPRYFLGHKGTFLGGAEAHTDVQHAASIAVTEAALPELMVLAENVSTAIPVGLSLALMLAQIFTFRDRRFMKEQHQQRDGGGPGEQEQQQKKQEEGESQLLVPASSNNSNNKTAVIIITRGTFTAVGLVFILSAFLIWAVDFVITSLLYQSTFRPGLLAAALLRNVSVLAVLLLRPLHKRCASAVARGAATVWMWVAMVAPFVVSCCSTVALNLSGGTFLSSPAAGIFVHSLVACLMVAVVFSVGTIGRRPGSGVGGGGAASQNDNSTTRRKSRRRPEEMTQSEYVFKAHYGYGTALNDGGVDAKSDATYLGAPGRSVAVWDNDDDESDEENDGKQQQQPPSAEAEAEAAAATDSSSASSSSSSSDEDEGNSEQRLHQPLPPQAPQSDSDYMIARGTAAGNNDNNDPNSLKYASRISSVYRPTDEGQLQRSLAAADMAAKAAAAAKNSSSREFSLPPGFWRFAFVVTALALWIAVLALRWHDAFHNNLRATLINHLRDDDNVTFPANVSRIHLPIDDGIDAYVDGLQLALYPLLVAVVLLSFSAIEYIFLAVRWWRGRRSTVAAADNNNNGDDYDEKEHEPSVFTRITNVLSYTSLLLSVVVLSFKNYVADSHLDHLIPDCAPQFHRDLEFLLRTLAGLFFDTIVLGRVVPLIASLPPCCMRVNWVFLRNAQRRRHLNHHHNGELTKSDLTTDFWSSLSLSALCSVCLVLPLTLSVQLGEAAIPVSLCASAIFIVPSLVLCVVRACGVVERLTAVSRNLLVVAKKSDGDEQQEQQQPSRCRVFLSQMLQSFNFSFFWTATYLPLWLVFAAVLFEYDQDLQSAVTTLLKSESVKLEIFANLLSAGVAFLDVSNLLQRT